jgi:ATP-dependent DNA ligase
MILYILFEAKVEKGNKLYRRRRNLLRIVTLLRASDILPRLLKGQEFVIGGYRPGMEPFESILVGYYEGNRLMFAGKVGKGFAPVHGPWSGN